MLCCETSDMDEETLPSKLDNFLVFPGHRSTLASLALPRVLSLRCLPPTCTRSRAKPSSVVVTSSLQGVPSETTTL